MRNASVVLLLFIGTGLLLLFLGFNDVSVIESTPTPTSTPFDPLDLNPLMFFRSDMDVTDAGGGNVSNWGDQTSNTYDLAQGTSGNQPAIQSNAFGTKNGIRFDAVDDYLEQPSSYVEPYGVGYVLIAGNLLTQDTGGNQSLLSTADTNDTNEFWTLKVEDPGDPFPFSTKLQLKDSDTNEINATSSLDADYHMWELSYSGSIDFTMYIDGETQTLDTLFRNSVRWWDDISSDTDITSVGSLLADAVYSPASIDLGVLFITATIPSDLERVQLREWVVDWAEGDIPVSYIEHRPIEIYDRITVSISSATYDRIAPALIGAKIARPASQCFPPVRCDYWISGRFAPHEIDVLDAILDGQEISRGVGERYKQSAIESRANRQ